MRMFESYQEEASAGHKVLHSVLVAWVDVSYRGNVEEDKSEGDTATAMHNGTTGKKGKKKIKSIISEINPTQNFYSLPIVRAAQFPVASTIQ